MFISLTPLLTAAARYQAAAMVRRESTVSHRIFGDTKKLAAIRLGESGLTIDRYNAAMRWLRDHWPEGQPLPPELSDGCAQPLCEKISHEPASPDAA